jgi:hypothetical protein
LLPLAQTGRLVLQPFYLTRAHSQLLGRFLIAGLHKELFKPSEQGRARWLVVHVAIVGWREVVIRAEFAQGRLSMLAEHADLIADLVEAHEP